MGEGVHGRRERLPNDSTEGFSVELYSLFGLLKSVARERREKFSVVRTGGYFERFGRHSFGRRIALPLGLLLNHLSLKMIAPSIFGAVACISIFFVSTAAGYSVIPRPSLTSFHRIASAPRQRRHPLGRRDRFPLEEIAPLYAYPTVPEPSGGTVIEPSSSKENPGVPGGASSSSSSSSSASSSTVKVMESNVLESEDGVSSYWVRASASSQSVLDIKKKLMIASAKKANFPGFRKGQIPPYAIGRILGFAVREAVQDRMREVLLEEYNLESVKKEEDAEGDITVLEDMDELIKEYKEGEDVEFTATFYGRERVQGDSAAKIAELIEKKSTEVK